MSSIYLEELKSIQDKFQAMAVAGEPYVTPEPRLIDSLPIGGVVTASAMAAAIYVGGFSSAASAQEMSAVPTAVSATAPSITAKPRIVRDKAEPGDTMSGMAQELHADLKLTEQINSSSNPDPNKIMVGKFLKFIPDSSITKGKHHTEAVAKSGSTKTRNAATPSVSAPVAQKPHTAPHIPSSSRQAAVSAEGQNIPQKTDAPKARQSVIVAQASTDKRKAEPTPAPASEVLQLPEAGSSVTRADVPQAASTIAPEAAQFATSSRPEAASSTLPLPDPAAILLPPAPEVRSEGLSDANDRQNRATINPQPSQQTSITESGPTPTAAPPTSETTTSTALQATPEPAPPIVPVSPIPAVPPLGAISPPPAEIILPPAPPVAESPVTAQAPVDTPPQAPAAQEAAPPANSNSETIPSGMSIIPEPYRNAFIAAGTKHNVSPALIAGLFTEENFTKSNPKDLEKIWANFFKRHPDPNSGWPTNKFKTMGPFQFIPGTWATFGEDGNGDGIKDPQNIVDGAAAAAKYIASNGATLNNSPDSKAWHDAIWNYNHAEWYVKAVLMYYNHYNQQAGPGTPSLAVASAAPALPEVAANSPLEVIPVPLDIDSLLPPAPSLDAQPSDNNALATPPTGGQTSPPASVTTTSQSPGQQAGVNSFRFPLDVSQQDILTAQPMRWCVDKPTNCHHDYNAADIFARTGTHVTSPVNGTVISAREDASNNPRRPTVGSRVQVRGADGNLYYFAHMRDGLAVHNGQTIHQGDLIGAVGEEYDAMNTPTHLHFDMMPPGHASRPACRGAGCRSKGFLNVQPLLNESFHRLEPAPTTSSLPNVPSPPAQPDPTAPGTTDGSVAQPSLSENSAVDNIPSPHPLEQILAELGLAPAPQP